MTNRTLQKNMFQVGVSLIGIAIMLGAFGAHGLKKVASIADVSIFEKGVHYQMIHAFALIIFSLSLRRLKENTIIKVFQLFLIGIILFSGSLYFLALRPALGLADKINWVGIITPFGGICFIVGWFYLAYNGYKPFEIEPIKGE